MLCSAAELELSNDHDGIMELPDDAPVGVAYARWAGLDDPVIDVALTPNRPDATGVSGIARDLAAAGLGTLQDARAETGRRRFRLPDPGASRFRARGRAPLPGLRAAPRSRRPQRSVAGMDAEASAGDRAQADQRAGRHHQLRDLRPRPPPARVRPRQGRRRSDGAARAAGERACWRSTARPMRSTRAWSSSPTPRASNSIAGVMGGEHSGCDEQTRDVLIESALWDPTNIAQTGRKLGIVTDARYRFERGVDPDFCVPGCDLATELVLDICGGEPSRMIVAGDPSAPSDWIDFPYGEVRRLIGVDIPRDEGEAILAPARLRRRGRQGQRSVLAAGRHGEGRRRRADPADRRRRPGADDPPAPPRRGRARAGADAAAEAHPPRQADARALCRCARP